MNLLKTFSALALALIATQITAQPASKGRTADLNHDGISDILAFVTDPEPCDDNYQVTFTDGKSGKTGGVLREEYCRCHIRSLLPIPAFLLLPENTDVLATIKTKLLPPERATPDPSFAWILRGLENRCQLETHVYFELIIDPSLERIPKQIVLPYTYSLLVSGKKNARLRAGSLFEGPVTEDQGYAIYYGHNHYRSRNPRADSLELAATTKDLKVFRTSHGLVAQSSTDHHWLFVTDHALTGAPDKLRWPSIGDVAVWNNRLLVLQHRKPVSSGMAIFLIDLENGRTVRLRKDLLGGPDDRIKFALAGDTLELKATAPGDAEAWEVDLTLPLETLLEEMDRL